mmetsp:Transcript_30717/g.57505  ORF Transcript_30717/g.57505 Transcript_30717/m.57505 type:complete len:198 (+) Transcript_30717:51-644(+)
MNENALKETGFVLHDGKATEQMRKSIHKLASLLVCPLCKKIFDQPTTLASCAHSFCVDCIDNYGCGSWVCPVDGCGMPLSIVGGHGGSYRKINPQLSQTVESLRLICQNLNRSSDQWWMGPSTVRAIQKMHEERQQDFEHEDDSVGRREGQCDKDEEEEMIDLQADAGGDDGRVRYNPNDDDDLDSIDSDDSIWNRK